jgi:hypothetical protein
MQALAKRRATTAHIAPKARSRTTFPDPAEQAGSDWDASGSFDGLGMQAVAKSKSSSLAPPGSGYEAPARTEQLDESMSDWDASGSMEGVQAPRAKRGSTKRPVGANMAKTAAATASAPLVGLGGASRFGVQSSLDVLQQSNSFDEPGPQANLEASNDWDMSGSIPPTPQAATKAQAHAKPKATAKEPSAAVVGPQSGQHSAREQQLAADLGLSEASDFGDEDDDVSLPGM